MAWEEKNARLPVTANDKQAFLDVCARFLAGEGGVDPGDARRESSVFLPEARTAVPVYSDETWTAAKLDSPRSAPQLCYTVFESRRVLIKSCLICGVEGVTTPDGSEGGSWTREGSLLLANHFARRCLVCVCEQCLSLQNFHSE